MTKRNRFLITSFLLSIGFVAIQFINDQNRFWTISLLGLATLILFIWSLYEGLGKNMTLLSLVLPVLFTLGVGFFWFLLPSSVYTKIPVIILYAAGIYVLASTMNIWTVSAIRTIALFRAARGVGFVLSLLTSFLIFDSILSLKLSIFLAIPLIFLFSLLIFMPSFWAVNLEKDFSKNLLIISSASALSVSQIAMLVYFWPLTLVTASLLVTVSVYILLGLGQAELEGRLFKATVREHLLVGVVVLTSIFLSTHWG